MAAGVSVPRVRPSTPDAVSVASPVDSRPA